MMSSTDVAVKWKPLVHFGPHASCLPQYQPLVIGEYPGAARPDRGWVLPRVPIGVRGRRIEGGMIYVGTRLKSLDRSGPEPSLINPQLHVAWRTPDFAGIGMRSWGLSYHGLNPVLRAAYLWFLTAGRDLLEIAIGFVVLYLCGLERRLVGDLRLSLHRSDTARIVGEIRRLQERYGSIDRRFHDRTAALLALVEARVLVEQRFPPPVWHPEQSRSTIPSKVLIGVGRFVRDSRPLPAEWAVSFIKHHPKARLRTPVLHCPAEFDELFRLAYQQRFGEGLVIAEPSRRIRVAYRPISPGIRPYQVDTSLPLPDVSDERDLFAELHAIAEDCTQRLDGLSRQLGRGVERESITALAVLPAELVPSHGGPRATGLSEWLATNFANIDRADLDNTKPHGAHPDTTDSASAVTDSAATASVLVPVALSGLLDCCGWSSTATLGRREAVVLAEVLERFGVGIEPDPRFGAPPPAAGSIVVLFRLPSRVRATPSTAFRAAATIAELAAATAVASGVGTTAQRSTRLAADVATMVTIDDAERLRLHARITQLLSGGAGWSRGLATRVGVLDLDQRQRTGDLLARVASESGPVAREAVEVLTDLFRVLELDPVGLYGHVHDHAFGEDRGPVTVRSAAPAATWQIPPPATAETVLVLDAELLDRRVRETIEVSARLAAIYVDDDPGEPRVVTAAFTADDRPVGLDAAHRSLADHLIRQASWSRAEVAALAAGFGLRMLNASLASINEDAVARCGEPLIDGHDPLTINPYALEELHNQ